MQSLGTGCYYKKTFRGEQAIHNYCRGHKIDMAKLVSLYTVVQSVSIGYGVTNLPMATPDQSPMVAHNMPQHHLLQHDSGPGNLP